MLLMFKTPSRTSTKKVPSLSGKEKGKSNGNIMNFFQRKGPSDRSDASPETQELFLGPIMTQNSASIPAQTPTPPHDTPLEDAVLDRGQCLSHAPSPLSRYNEDSGPMKRRKTGGNNHEEKSDKGLNGSAGSKGPFLDDSDEEDFQTETTVQSASNVPPESIDSFTSEIIDGISAEHSEGSQGRHQTIKAPHLKHEPISIDIIDEFDGIEDFIDDEFPDEGEEYIERRFMEQQAELEMSIGEDDDPGPGEIEEIEECAAVVPQDSATATCPICGGDTTGMSEQQVSVHVNDCIDGKAKPLPQQKAVPQLPQQPEQPEQKVEAVVPAPKRFQKSAIARPGQEVPFNLMDIGAPTGSSTAFSKLMSGHAEDTAWASAAAAEAASRGKPAYQRTCPFYKIMPGFYTCVDAFRYGAVQGCNAYFLSHFHSDHYIGLTSSWCHGPIYCSRVTGNLVRRQLRVDPKWVVDLRFEDKVEIPNTQGVEVTMIPANHCPGSSLFLFEKTVGKGKAPKVQRVLHCGDFRACPAHVQHPKLRPEFLDHVTGKLAQQKINVCYLDTTYLTPKYAFPSQEQVIKACSEMCVSLSKEIIDSNDSWETVKRERAGAGMVKFVRSASIKNEPSLKQAPDVKEESTDLGELPIKREDEDSPPQPSRKKRRGRLLVIVGTYSIGKERICLGVAKALNSKIYAPPNKQKVVAALEDPELSSLMTSDPLEAQVHMQMLMEIRAETLADYLTDFKPHFSRIVGFRPSGWNYRPPNSRFTESPSVQTVLFSENWKSNYTMHELTPQRGSTSQAMCFGVPYSEHSSFRELTMFCCALRIDKIIPTVNVGSAKSRERMKGWCEKWAMEKKKNGLFKVQDGETAWS